MNEIKVFRLKTSDAVIQRASTGWLMKWNLGNFWVKAPGFILNYTWDSVAEVIASAIACDIGIDTHLKYELCIINLDSELNLIGCISRNFRPTELRELTVQKMIQNNILSNKHYYNKEGYNKLILEIKEIFNLDIRKYLEDMILIDAIILNSDRNLWNISILIDNKLNGYIAPVYDFGNSLGLTGGRQGSFYENALYSTGLIARPFNNKFEEQVKYIRNNREYHGELIQTKELFKLLYTEFTQDNNKYNVVNAMSVELLKYVWQVVNKRYNTIIINKAWKS